MFVLKFVYQKKKEKRHQERRTTYFCFYGTLLSFDASLVKIETKTDQQKLFLEYIAVFMSFVDDFNDLRGDVNMCKRNLRVLWCRVPAFYYSYIIFTIS